MKTVNIHLSVKEKFWIWTWNWRKKLTFQLPESFNEMSRRQLMAYIKWVYLRRDKLFDLDPKGRTMISDVELYNFTCLKMLRILLGIPSSIFRQLENSEDNCQVYDLLKFGIVDFIFEGKNNLVKNHLSHFYAQASKYYGPGDELCDLALVEFAMADLHYYNFMVNGSVEELEMLAACLYRPGKSRRELKQPDWDGDLRQRFNQYRVAGIAESIKGLSLRKKILILLFFAGCRGSMEVKYPELFGKKSASAASGGGWVEFIIAAAGGKFGDIDKTTNANVHTVFKAMDMMAEQEAKQPESVI